MSDQTKIEWAEATWNPVTGCDWISPGCDWISPGCDRCYARTMARRLQAMGTPGYAGGFAVTQHPEALGIPAHWRKPRRIFVCSMGDLFHVSVSTAFRLRVYEAMLAAPHHTYLLLTKRPERMVAFLNGPLHDRVQAFPQERYPIWWHGTTVERLEYMGRAKVLSGIRVPQWAVRTFLSFEPLLGLFPETDYIESILRKFPAIIIGGESGPGARRMDLEWARSLVENARTAGCRVLVKQLGTYQARANTLSASKGQDPAEWDRIPGGQWLREHARDDIFAEELRTHVR